MLAPSAVLAHFAHSLARGTVNNWMAIYSVFLSVLAHSAMTAAVAVGVVAVVAVEVAAANTFSSDEDIVRIYSRVKR